MEFLRADYTEVWISSSVVPLIQFAECVRTLASTQLDLVIGDEFPSGLKAKLREFDEVITWYGSNRAEFREAMNAVHSRCQFLEALPGADWDGHAGDFFLGQVGAPLGILPRIKMETVERRGTMVIQPFSGSARKNWPLERYRELASRVPLAVEWVAGPEETLPEARRFENLMDLARWMAGAAVYLGNDSGISHLAAALGLKSVVLFGLTEPAVWAPRGDQVKVVSWQPLEELPVETVMAALVGG